MNKHSGPIVAQKYSLTVINCQRCGFYHLDPIPDTSLYANGAFYSDIKPDYGKEYNEDASWWNMLYGDWLSLLKDAPNKDLVDVGAGTGHFVRYARLMRWLAEGIEPDYEMAHRYGLFHGEYAHFGNDTYLRGTSVISANWVMEHLPDPSHFINWAKSVLAPGGLLLLTVPNDFSAIQLSVMDKIGRPFYWLHKTHINYWNAESFRQFLVNRHGLSIVHIYGSWQPERFLEQGHIYLDDHELGRKLHRERKQNELTMDARTRRLQRQMWGMLGLGRDLTFVVRKQ